MQILTIVLLMLFLVAVLFTVRTIRVFRYRMALLDAIRTRAGKSDFDSYFSEFNSVTYESMLFKFWVRLDRFYQGRKLLALAEDVRHTPMISQ